MTPSHIPVLYHEVLHYLQPHTNGVYLDGTAGAGGHTKGILEVAAPEGRVLSLDKDPTAIAYIQERLTPFEERLTLVHASYADMEAVAAAQGFHQFDGILLDLGLSSRQLDTAERGFSFMREGPLDMRFDQTHGETAAFLLNNLTAEALADIFWQYGEERRSRHLARIIVANRPHSNTKAFAELIAQHSPRRGRIHPATRIFQALRIAVNDELQVVEQGLRSGVRLLKPNGRFAVISFHSLEDRMVKRYFRQLSQDCVCPPEQPLCTCDAKATLRLVKRKAIQATAEEIAANPRSRSARLRVAEKVSFE